MLDVFVASEGEPEVVMFSGGEPTIHQEILGVPRRRAGAADPHRHPQHQRHPPRHRPGFVPAGLSATAAAASNIYLQFDGLTRVTHREIRGRDLREVKRRALDNCADAGLTVTLVATVETRAQRA